MKLPLFVFIFLLIAFISSCQSIHQQKLIDEYKRSLNFFNNELVNHFPEDLHNQHVSLGSNVLTIDTLPMIGFDCKEMYLRVFYQEEEYNMIKEKIKASSSASYSATDTMLLLIFSYSDVIIIDGKTYKDSETIEKKRLAKHNTTYANSLPLPMFEDEYFAVKSTSCGLTKDFMLYVLDAEPGKYLPDEDLQECECLPEKWKHGYSKGAALSDEKQTVIYWIAVW